MSKQDLQTDGVYINRNEITMTDLLVNGDTMTRIQQFAKIMSQGHVAVPEHLRNKPADCMAIAMQAAQWGMDPFKLAQKTFVIGGKLGYEAQMVNSLIARSGVLKRRFDYDFFGDWDKIIGKFEIKTSQKGNEYAAPGWAIKDEEGIGIKVIGHLKGEAEPRTIEVLLKQCRPRNSTLWATDPQQQIIYAATQKWARRYVPDVVLGIYTEADPYEEPVTREMGNLERVDEPSQAPPKPKSKAESAKEKARARSKPAVKEEHTPSPAPKLAEVTNAMNEAQDMGALDATAKDAEKLNEGDKRLARQCYVDNLRRLAPPATVDPETGEEIPGDL